MLTPNPARGEVVVILAGAPRRLCLTLGALARIEAALNLSDWSQLPDRIATLSAGELSAILAALLEGGGEAPAAPSLNRAGLQDLIARYPDEEAL